MAKKFAASELILNARGAVYHLDLMPDEIADTIITVGDPQRVKKISQYFDRIEVKRKHREFKTHTGYLNGKRLTVLSTGIGTGNIDIAWNELDALVNINLKTKSLKKKRKSLNFIRIGTSGAQRKEIKVDSFVVNTAGIGTDGLGLFYNQPAPELDKQITQKIIPLYYGRADKSLIKLAANRMTRGVALTAGGFYGPQGRSLRLNVKHELFLDEVRKIRIDDIPVTNMEMETAAMYMLSTLMGHKAISCNAIIANRVKGTFSSTPGETVDRLIRSVLHDITHD